MCPDVCAQTLSDLRSKQFFERSLGKLKASCYSRRKTFNLGSIAVGLIVSRHMTHSAKLLRDKRFLMNCASVWTLLINYQGLGLFRKWMLL